MGEQGHEPAPAPPAAQEAEASSSGGPRLPIAAAATAAATRRRDAATQHENEEGGEGVEEGEAAVTAGQKRGRAGSPGQGEGPKRPRRAGEEGGDEGEGEEGMEVEAEAEAQQEQEQQPAAAAAAQPAAAAAVALAADRRRRRWEEGQQQQQQQAAGAEAPAAAAAAAFVPIEGAAPPPAQPPPPPVVVAVRAATMSVGGLQPDQQHDHGPAHVHVHPEEGGVGGDELKEEEEEEEAQVQEPGAASNNNNNAVEHQCPLCWELVARPVTLDCGFSLCEACVAQLLLRAIQSRQSGAVCPVLGSSCPRGRVRTLPCVNVMLQAQLRALYGPEYDRRCAEVDGDAEAAAAVKTVKDRMAQLLALRSRQRAAGAGAPGAVGANGVRIPAQAGVGVGAGGGPPGARGRLEIVFNGLGALRRLRPPPLGAVFFLLCPHLLAALALRYLHSPTPNLFPDGFARNPFGWELLTAPGPTWRATDALGACRVTSSEGGNPHLATGVGPALAAELLQWRPLPKLWALRLQSAAAIGGVHGWVAAVVFLAQLLQVLFTYLLLARGHIRRRRLRGYSWTHLALLEVLTLLSTACLTELASAFLWSLQVSLGPYLRCPIRYRLGEVGRLLWSWRSLSQSMNAAFVLVMGAALDAVQLRRAEHELDVLEGMEGAGPGMPWWKTVLLDPRCSLLLRKQVHRGGQMALLIKDLLRRGRGRLQL